nr:glycoside hydrolase family 31 protein [Candidatus Sigynarchaeota archaeon]
EDEYMFGRNLLVAPILTRVNTRKVYLPRGTWCNFWTLDAVKGPAWIDVTCLIDRVPVFLREGTISPMGPVQQHVDEVPFDELELAIIPGDDGTITDYIIAGKPDVKISAKMAGRTLRIEASMDFRTVKSRVPATCKVTSITFNGKDMAIATDHGAVNGQL